MKILITGAKGMLGQMVQQELKKHELIVTDRQELDITDAKTVSKIFSTEKPQAVINCAAYVDVEKAESDKILAKKINVTGAKNIAKYGQQVGATVIHISTDYVFDGKKTTPYQEKDKVNPLGVYAKTKEQAECEIIKGSKKHYILRVAWLFGECDSGRNFVDSMISLAKKLPEIKVINDQIGSPTYTRDVAKTISKILSKAESKQPIEYGIYNFSGKGESTRFEFTKEIFKLAKLKTKLIPITTKEFFAVAPRPAYSYLDKTKIEKALNIKVRSWKIMLKDYFKRTI